MYETDELLVPNSADDEAKAVPFVSGLAGVIGAIVATDGFISPARFETAMSVAEAIGEKLGEPSLTRVFVLRALISPRSLWAAIADLKTAAASRPVAERAAIMRELARLMEGDAKLAGKGLRSELSKALEVRPPGDATPSGTSVFDAFEFLRERAKLLVRPEPQLFTEAREFAADFNDSQLLAAIHDGDNQALFHSLGRTIAALEERLAEVTRGAEAAGEASAIAQQLDDVADQVEQVARQRYASITRRAAMLKRHIREDLNALAEDAAEEFEVDFRRLTETRRGLFGRLDTNDLNDRLVTKNLERRYSNLTRRYQDQLDLLDVEVYEYSDEFTRVGDEALRPMARHEFRSIAPHPSLELRVKAAADRASTKTLLGGAAGIAASGAAMHVGLMSASVAAGPAGAVVLGAVALAGVWKIFANPGERRKRDPRERTRALEGELRAKIMAHLPDFDQAVETILARFRAVVIPDMWRPSG